MRKRLLYLLFTCALISSCKKNELPRNDEEVGTPVFYSKCTINGMPLTIEAGVNNYAIIPSHYQDKNNLYIYKSEIKQISCAGNCGAALTFLINDTQLSEPNAKMQVENALTTGNHAFNVASLKPVFYTGSFIPEYKEGDSHNWKFSTDGSVQTAQNVTKEFVAGDKVSVDFTVVDIGGISANLTKEFRVGNPLQANIPTPVRNANTLTYKFSVNPSNPSYKYLWDFHDSSADQISTEAQPPEHFFSNSPTYSYITTLRLTNSNNDTCLANYQVTTNECNANFESHFTPFLNPKLASAITILYTDQNGVVYSSADLNQPGSTKFEVVSVENYKNNDKNEPTKKLKINFNCSFNTSTGPINITNGEAVIVVSYK